MRARSGTRRSGRSPDFREATWAKCVAPSDEDGWRAKEADVEAIAAARHADPFAVLGPHLTRAGWAIRAFAPDVVSVRAVTRDGAPLVELVRRSDDFFEALAPNQSERPAYRLEFTRADGVEICDDPYAFGPVLGPLDEHLLVEGAHRQLYMRLGAQLMPPRGRRRRRFRRLGPARGARLGGRRFQPLGRTPHADAQAPRQRPVGGVRPGPRRRRGLQIRDSRRRTASCCRSRPIRSATRPR